MLDLLFIASFELYCASVSNQRKHFALCETHKNSLKIKKGNFTNVLFLLFFCKLERERNTFYNK